MWQKTKAKITTPDKLFSRHIRDRDGWRCQYRFKCFGMDDFRLNPGGLDNSHFQKRGKFSVRYDEENCDAACKKCHNFVETDPNGQRVLEEWKLAQLGEKRYNMLLIRANTTGKNDPFMAMLYVKALIKETRDKKLALE